jgi:hypothetical protein
LSLLLSSCVVCLLFGMLFVLQVISVEPPNFVELEVTEAPPGVKGNTASGEHQQQRNHSAPSQS